jgi:hypothetical protein
VVSRQVLTNHAPAEPLFPPQAGLNYSYAPPHRGFLGFQPMAAAPPPPAAYPSFGLHEIELPLAYFSESSFANDGIRQALAQASRFDRRQRLYTRATSAATELGMRIAEYNEFAALEGLHGSQSNPARVPDAPMDPSRPQDRGV